MSRRESDARRLGKYVETAIGRRVGLEELGAIAKISKLSLGRRITTREILRVLDHFDLPPDPVLSELNRLGDVRLQRSDLHFQSEDELLEGIVERVTELRRRRSDGSESPG